MPVSDWLSPGTIVNVAGSDADWTNPSNAGDGNQGTYASASIPKQGQTDFLRATNFSWPSIGTGTLLGIEFRIRRDSDRGNVYDTTIQTVSAATGSGNLAVADAWNNITTTFGSPFETLNVVVADLDSSFGIEIQAEVSGAAREARLREIEARIFYSFPDAQGFGVVPTVEAATSGTADTEFEALHAEVAATDDIKAAVFFSSYGYGELGENTPNNEAGGISIGLWDGATNNNTAVVHTKTYDNAGTLYCRSYHDKSVNGSLIKLMADGASVAANLDYDTPSLVDGTVSLTRSGSNTNAYQMSAVLLSEEIIADAEVGVFTGGAASGNKAVSGLGFQPDAIIFLTDFGTTNDTITNDAVLCMGFAADSPSGDIEQATGGYQRTNGETRSSSPVDTEVASGYIIKHPVDHASGRTVLLQSFDTDGFTVTHGSLSDTSARYIYLALKLQTGYTAAVPDLSSTNTSTDDDHTVDSDGGTPIGIIGVHNSDSTLTGPGFGATDGGAEVEAHIAEWEGQTGTEESRLAPIFNSKGLGSWEEFERVANFSANNITFDKNGDVAIDSFGLVISKESTAVNVNVNATGVSASYGLGSVSVSADANVSVTGLSISAQLGDEATSGNASVYPSGVSASYGLGSVSVNTAANVSVTGLSLSYQLGDEATSGNASVYPTGVSASYGLGTVTVNADYSVSVTGVSASYTLGSVSVSLPVNVPVTGVSAAFTLGSVTVDAIANVYVAPSGVSASYTLGSVSVSLPVNAPVSGVSASYGLGSVTVSADANASPSGVSASYVLGSVSVSADANVSVTGLSISAQLGDEATSGNASVYPSGVSASYGLGLVSVNAIQNVNVSVTGVSASYGLGTVEVKQLQQVAVTGVSASYTLGSVSVSLPVNVPVSGVSASYGLGSVSVSLPVNVPVTGFSLSYGLGSVTVNADANASPSGVSASYGLGSVSVVQIVYVPATGVSAAYTLGSVEAGRPFASTPTIVPDYDRATTPPAREGVAVPAASRPSGVQSNPRTVKVKAHNRTTKAKR